MILTGVTWILAGVTSFSHDKGAKANVYQRTGRFAGVT